MNAFPDDRQGRSDEDPLGPATPRRSELVHEGDDALLPPFTRGGAVPPAASAGESSAGESAVGESSLAGAPFGESFVGEAEEVQDHESPFAFEGGENESPFAFEAGDADGQRGGDDAGEELPWLVTAEEGAAARRADAAADWAAIAGEPAGEGETASDGEMPAWLDLDVAEEPEQEDRTPASSSESGPALSREDGEEAGAEGVEGAPALAERFESIARLLRARGVAGVLESGNRDPLGLLLTGFALGYLQRDEDAGS
jgi:hypothetical protein